jgi:hypothetical protein
MKKLLLLLLLPLYSSGQIYGTYAQIATMKSMSQLTPNVVYQITDLGKIEIVAKTTNTFFYIPYKRSIYALDYDEELFNFDTKLLIGIDNISCIVRCINSNWYVLNDAGHIPYKVGTLTDNLVINFTKTYDRVMGFQASIDETYAQQNGDITVGAGVGYSSATLHFLKTVIINGQLVRQYMTKQELSITWSNVFVNARMAKFIQL